MFCGQKYRKAGGENDYDIWMIDRNVVSSGFLFGFVTFCIYSIANTSSSQSVDCSLRYFSFLTECYPALKSPGGDILVGQSFS